MKILKIVLLTFIISLGIISNTYANTDLSVEVDGLEIDFSEYGAEPYNDNGTVMLPFRSIFEAIGGEIDTSLYDKLKAINFIKEVDGVKYDMSVNQRDSKIDMYIIYPKGEGDIMIMKTFSIEDVNIVNINGRLHVPVRVISEALGYEVDWIGATRTVTVDTSENNIDYPNSTRIIEFNNNQSDNSTNTIEQTEKNNLISSNDELTLAEKNLIKKNEITEEIKQQSAEQILSLVNELRTEHGLNSLELDQTLIDFAFLKAEDYNLGGYSIEAKSNDGYTGNHVSPRYGSPTEWYNSVYSTDYFITENYASTGVKKGEEAVVAFNMWLKSEGHKDAMLRPYLTKLGFGFYAITNKNTGATYGSTVMLLEMY